MKVIVPHTVALFYIIQDIKPIRSASSNSKAKQKNICIDAVNKLTKPPSRLGATYVTVPSILDHKSSIFKKIQPKSTEHPDSGSALEDTVTNHSCLWEHS